MYLAPGLYDDLINQAIQEELARYSDSQYYIATHSLTLEETKSHLCQYVKKVLDQALSGIDDVRDIPNGVRLVNEVIRLFMQSFPQDTGKKDLLQNPVYVLSSVLDKTQVDTSDYATYLEQIRPVTGLRDCTLFTGGHQELSMESELLREIQSADEIWLLVSFIKTQGVALLYPALEKHTNSGKPLRVLTSTYVQNTDYKAVKRLAGLPNTEIRISYNQEQESLHAKTYLFKRAGGHHTCYIGSSNISRKALTDGLEWNMKITQVELPHIIKKVMNRFQLYWGSEGFEPFLLGRDDRRLRIALGEIEEPTTLDFSRLDLMRAKKYQEEILEKLTMDREVHGEYRNLLVAATGTGKTVISAFDFKRYLEAHPQANLLFVAHRQEILNQALDTFRAVLRDENFGAVWHSDVQMPENMRHLFASKDTLYSRFEKKSWLPAPDYYDFIIIDEAHHVMAKTYQPLLTYFQPAILLGMTATPERADDYRNGSITQFFGNQISAEIRLADALNNHLLSPFKYFGVSDSVDLRSIKWRGGRYDAEELTKVYTENDRRTGVILDAMQRYLPNTQQARALCFCVNKEHARYMCAKFQLAGLKAEYFVSNDYTVKSRRGLIKQLNEGKINYLFVVDIFNEGVDIPNVDTVLFLRPTESLTIYLQQLGRGLRKAVGKAFVTVLDFVGQARAEFNYTDRVRALIGRTSMSEVEELEYHFPHMPFGCSITLEPKAREYILDNIRRATRQFSLNGLQQLLHHFPRDYDRPLTLANFLTTHHVPIRTFYKRMTWTEGVTDLVQKGVAEPPAHFHLSSESSDEECKLIERFKKMVATTWSVTDSASYFDFLYRLASVDFMLEQMERKPEEVLEEMVKRLCVMFYYDLYAGDAGRPLYNSYRSFLQDLSQHPVFIQECKMVLELLLQKTVSYEIRSAEKPNAFFPLMVHGRYTREQIKAAVGTSTISKKSSGREGVEVNKSEKVEALFVDLIKDRVAGSTTNYNDMAVTDTLFDWETQNKVSPETPTGQRYIKGTFKTLLFVREQAKTAEDKSLTQSYVYLGMVHLVRYQGAKPMTIRWKLSTPMPSSFWSFASDLGDVG
ncbi:MAG: DUF3427 domain-containing protein [Bacteroidaceae bacterium]